MVKSTSPAKANATLPKHSSPPQNKYKQVGSPKKDNNGEKVKDIHKIFPLSEVDGTPYGWAFLGFFDIKEWIQNQNISRTKLTFPKIHLRTHLLESLSSKRRPTYMALMD
jgi:hypothetical protein